MISCQNIRLPTHRMIMVLANPVCNTWLSLLSPPLSAPAACAVHQLLDVVLTRTVYMHRISRMHTVYTYKCVILANPRCAHVNRLLFSNTVPQLPGLTCCVPCPFVVQSLAVNQLVDAVCAHVENLQPRKPLVSLDCRKGIYSSCAPYNIYFFPSCPSPCR